MSYLVSNNGILPINVVPLLHLVYTLVKLPNMYIFNLSNDKDTKLKCANVTPLFKTGEPTDVNNYRPISQLPTPSKILEHLIHTQVTSYFDTFDILDSNQGGFRKNHSTTATTSHFLDDIYININNQKPTLAVFIDFKKAFTAQNRPLFERQDRCSLFSVLCYFRYFVRE